MSEMDCQHEGCNAVARGGAVFRLNPLGELPPVFSCLEHWPIGVARPDADDVAFAAILSPPTDA